MMKNCEMKSLDQVISNIISNSKILWLSEKQILEYWFRIHTANKYHNQSVFSHFLH